jgi:hypothetical protein
LRRHPLYRQDWRKHHDPAFPLYWSMEGGEEKYGRDLLLNPENDSLPESWLEPICSPVSLEMNDAEWELSSTTTKFVVRAGLQGGFIAHIDPSLPVNEQADAIAAELSIWAQPFSDRRRLVGLYLQVLDAREAQEASGMLWAPGRITNEEIAEKLSEIGEAKYGYGAERVPGLAKKAYALASELTGIPWPPER